MRRRGVTVIILDHLLLLLFLLLLFPAILFAIDSRNTDQSPVVQTKFGPIVGIWSKSSNGINIANFLGIPYAKPPINDLRFRRPQAWNNSWNLYHAFSDSSPCIQIIKINTTIGSEDCLYLNVFVPANQSVVKLSKKPPVLVFIHGGAFTKGSGNSKLYSANHWADQGVILVVVNYRLGPFGFYSLGNKVAPGNYGIKDIMMALQWIQENIESFGGDQNSVTLMGESSGAASVHILALSKKTEGLFDKFILHSGTALASWAVHSKHNIRKVSENMAKYLRCPNILDETDSLNNNDTTNDNVNNDFEQNYTSYEKDLLTIKCMRSYDPKSILMALSYMYFRNKHPSCIFGPNIEDESSDAIITMFPIEIIRKKLFRDIPSIMGMVQDEGLLKTYDFYANSTILDLFMKEFGTILPAFLEVQDVIRDADDFVDALKNFYFDPNSNKTIISRITEMASDGLFKWPLYKTIDNLSKLMKSNIYIFSFEYFGTFSTNKLGITIPIGISHSDDIQYFFSPSTSITRSDKIVIHVLTELWSNFIRKGVPSTWSEPNWPAYRNHHEFMLFKGNQEINITIENNFLTERMKFWDNLMYNYTDKRTKWYLINENIHVPSTEPSRGTIHFQTTNYVPLLTIFTSILISIRS